MSLLGKHHPKPLKTSHIAEVTRVPRSYLVKVLQALSRAGIVETRRGIGGGIALAQEVDAVTILDVVNAVDPIQRTQRR